jgi:BirA family biotin operon repressor/biotin-[acetyl-CoA-carboxylase] ligase
MENVRTPFGALHHLATTTSTNTLALEAARSGTADGVWVADEQTAGRGRAGHTWLSDAGSAATPNGLYVSSLIRPVLTGAHILKLSLAAGLAAQSAVADVTGVRIDLRWPNDLMLTAPDGVERKCGGILIETAFNVAADTLAYAVIGIGINLNRSSFPPELADLATSLRIASGKPTSRDALLNALLYALNGELTVLECDPAGILTRFEHASIYARDLRVHVAEATPEQGDGYTGTTAGLDPQGLLRIRLDDGSTRLVRHGGVRRA